ncbi:MAG: nitrite reductase [Bacteroidota bacterium]
MTQQSKPQHYHDPAVRDIVELTQKIQRFHRGELDEDRFKHYRLTRGVYGQRQVGVHMFRTKIPFGRLRAAQLIRLADVAEKYTNGNLHLTTRQNIQMHHVKLDDAPAIWTELNEVGVTAREACGNTVRNLTASANAGIDPDELFDVSPYVQAVYAYFLRNPICQEMGRKIKPAFSSSDRDSAFTYFHDFGFIPRIQRVADREVRGFKLVVGGGLGAQALVAQTAYEFIPTDRIIPFMEAAIRVFDRYGEREKRFKARMKFLLKKLGLEAFLELVETERQSLERQSVPIDHTQWESPTVPPLRDTPLVPPIDPQQYDRWLAANVFEQKQPGFYAAQLKIRLGDLDADTARALARIALHYAADDLRITVNQGILLRFIHPAYLPTLFNALHAIGLADPGFNSLADITSCPGTDTCNLAVTNSTGLALALEEVVREEYPHLITSSSINIKISGCMNACGQHMAANIGFHGSSIKREGKVLPAMQIVLGGGVDPDGKGYIAERVIKLPTKRIPDALRLLLDEYEREDHGRYFNDFVRQHGKRYFYQLLKELARTDNLDDRDFIDWGNDSVYQQAIGVGECAGVSMDLVSLILQDAAEKLELSGEAYQAQALGDSIYHSYSAMVIGAKALLLSEDIRCNTHRGIINDFQEHFIDQQKLPLDRSFPELVLQLNQQPPSLEFAATYGRQAQDFVRRVFAYRQQNGGGDDKLVIGNYYRA